jgi:hypothetical protein
VIDSAHAVGVLEAVIHTILKNEAKAVTVLRRFEVKLT